MDTNQIERYSNDSLVLLVSETDDQNHKVGLLLGTIQRQNTTNSIHLKNKIRLGIINLCILKVVYIV